MENLKEAASIKIPRSLGGHKTRGVFEGYRGARVATSVPELIPPCSLDSSKKFHSLYDPKMIILLIVLIVNVTTSPLISVPLVGWWVKEKVKT